MAKKVKDVKLDGVNLSDDLQLPEFNFESAPIKDDRKPAIKLKDAVLGGAKDTIKSPSFIRQLIRKSLPEGFGAAMDMADQAGGTLRSLYDDAALEIKPVIKDVRRVTKRLTPQMEQALPKSVAKKIKEWSQKDDGSGSGVLSRESQRDMGVQVMLADIFKMQTEQASTRDTQQEIQGRIGENLNQKRHLDMLGQLDAIRVSGQQVASYQQRIDAAFQRKSLELQFRHYFVASDSLEEQKRMNAESSTMLKAIVKNTGLPDYVKLNTSERLKEVMRNKFIDNVSQGIFSLRRDFFKNFGDKLKAGVKEKVGQFKDGVQSGLGAADAVADMSELNGMMGVKPKSMSEHVAGFAGSMGADYLGQKFGRHARKYLSKSPKLDKLNNQLLYGTANAPQLLGEAARSTKFDDTPVVGGGLRFLKDIALQALTPDKSLNADSASSMQNPDVFGRQTNKSITEIIPGLLARIHRELRILRTGDTNAKLTTYDFTSNTFSDADSVGKNILDSIVKPQEKISTKEDVNKLVGGLDTGGKLSDEQRKILGKFLLKENLNNRSGSGKRLSDRSAYTGEAAKHADQFAQVFSEFFADDPRARKQRVFGAEMSRLGAGMTDGRRTIQEHLNNGNQDQLAKLGLLSKDGKSIDMNRLFELFYEDDAPTAKPGGIPGLRHNGMPGAPHTFAPAGGFKRPAAPQTTDFTFSHPVTDTQPVTAAAATTPAPVSSDAIVAALKENSSKSISEVMSETLLRIEKKLNEGIGQAAGAGSVGGTGRGKGFWNKTLGEHGKSLLSLGGKALHAGGEMLKGAGKLGGMLGGIAWDAAGTMTGKANQIRNWAKDKLTARSDIFVPGELESRLKAWKLKAGHYRDKATGNVIKTFKDIKGAVIDEEGNDVMSADDAAKAYVKTNLGQKLISALGATAKGAKDTAKSLLGVLPPVYRFGMDMLKKTWGLLSRPQDVYVKGKDDPVLSALTMKAGGYRSRITGKVIHHPGEINGPVLDDQNITVLTAEQFAGGLYDINGKPLRTGVGKLLGMAGDAMKSASNTAKLIVDKARNLAGKAYGGLKKLGGKARKGLIGLLGGRDKDHHDVEGTGGMGGDAVISLLSDIRNLIDERFPKRKKTKLGDTDDDGVRDGDWQDLIKRKKAGGAAGAAGAGGAAAGGKDKDGKKDGEEGSSLLDTLTDGWDLLKGGKGKLGKLLGKGKSLLGGKAGGLLKGALLAGALGFGTDAIAGKMGVGGNAIDQGQDDANWDKMSMWQKAQSSAARGVEKGAGMFFMGNFANQAASKRIASETEYLNKQNATDAAGSKIGQPPGDGKVGAASSPPGVAAQTYTGPGDAAPPADAGTGSSVDAFLAVRLKAYGLSEPFAPSRLRAITTMESLLSGELEYSKGVAKWTGSIADFLAAQSGKCGFDGDQSEQARWMRDRFLPVFLAYATGVATQSGKESAPANTASSLSAQQTLDVARTTLGATTSGGGSVWGVSAMPWAGGAANSDSSSTDDNVRALTDKLKEKGVGSEAKPAGADDKSKPGTLSDPKSKALEDINSGKKPEGFMSKVGNALSEAWKGATTLASNAATMVKDSVGGLYSKAKEVFTGGNVVSQPGNGTGGDVNSIPEPKGNKSWAALKDTILAAAKAAGVDGKLMASMAAIESGFNYMVKAGSSSATGLYQFISGTWKTMLKKYGAKYGIDPNTEPTDPRANALMGAEFLKENQAALKSAIGRDPTDVDLYLAHFLGAGGAKKLLKADPASSAAELLPDAARANKDIFFEKGGAPRTVAQVYAEIGRRLQSRGKQFGIDVGTPGGTEEAKAGDTAKPDDKTAAAGGAAGAPKTTAGGSGATGGAIIPVADQTPGASSGSGATPTTSTAANTGGATGSWSGSGDPAASEAGSGFQARTQSMDAQAQYRRESTVDSLGPISDTLKETLGVNRQQLEALIKIRDILAASGGAGAAAAKPVQTVDGSPAEANPSASIDTGPKMAKQMTPAPVSMRKSQYA